MYYIFYRSSFTLKTRRGSTHTVTGLWPNHNAGSLTLGLVALDGHPRCRPVGAPLLQELHTRQCERRRAHLRLVRPPPAPLHVAQAPHQRRLRSLHGSLGTSPRGRLRGGTISFETNLPGKKGTPGRCGLQGTRPRAGQLRGPASRGLTREKTQNVYLRPNEVK
eukprot:1177078-Prorocentrum_minimum.AAC.1